MAASDDLDSTLALLDRLPAASRSSMVRMYRQALKDQLDQIAIGLQPGADLQSVIAQAHRIAGSAGMMQDLALCDVARAMESALREGRTEAARAQWPRLQDRAQVTLAALALAYPGLE